MLWCFCAVAKWILKSETSTAIVIIKKNKINWFRTRLWLNHEVVMVSDVTFRSVLSSEIYLTSPTCWLGSPTKEPRWWDNYFKGPVKPSRVQQVYRSCQRWLISTSWGKSWSKKNPFGFSGSFRFFYRREKKVFKNVKFRKMILKWI